MKQELSPTVVWSAIAAVVVIVVLVIVFGVVKPQIGPGPEIKPRPWSPSGYAGVPQDALKKGQQDGGTAPAPYHAPGQGAMGAPSAPSSGSK